MALDPKPPKVIDGVIAIHFSQDSLNWSLASESPGLAT
jgi:hypothetical protein